jgi:hypothetical protein
MRCLPMVAVLVASACGGGPEANPTGPTPTGSCSVSVAFDTKSFPASGGMATGQVTASASTCGWSFSPPSWVTINPSSGTGTATVVATVAPTLDARTGQVMFGMEPIVLTQAASPEADNLGFTAALCRVPARAGASTPGACTITQRPGRNPASTGIKVFADMRIFGRSADYQMMHVMAGAFDLDVAVPAGFPAGTVPIAFRITDAQGRSATTTASLIIQ